MKEFEANIGWKVIKHQPKKGKLTRKKFKSGLYVNTIKGVIDHPVLNIPAYTFEEDESYVECRRCKLTSDLTVEQLEILRQIAVRHQIIIITAEQGIGKSKS